MIKFIATEDIPYINKMLNRTVSIYSVDYQHNKNNSKIRIIDQEIPNRLLYHNVVS